MVKARQKDAPPKGDKVPKVKAAESQKHSPGKKRLVKTADKLQKEAIVQEKQIQIDQDGVDKQPLQADPQPAIEQQQSNSNAQWIQKQQKPDEEEESPEVNDGVKIKIEPKKRPRKPRKNKIPVDVDEDILMSSDEGANEMSSRTNAKQAAKDPRYHMKQTFLKYVSKDNPKMYEWIAKWVTGAIDGCEGATFKELNDLYVEEALKPNFKNIIKLYVVRPNHADNNVVRDTDVLTWIDLCFQVGAVEKVKSDKNTIFEFMRKILKSWRIPNITLLDKLHTACDSANMQFLREFWQWHLYKNEKYFPNAFVCYLAAKWDMLEDLARQSIERLDLSNINITRVIIKMFSQQPGQNRSETNHLADVAWALGTENKYLKISTMAFIFENHGMMLTHQIVKEFDNVDPTTQANVCDLLRKCCEGQQQATAQVVEIIQTISMHDYLVYSLNERSPKQGEPKITVDEMVTILRGLKFLDMPQLADYLAANKSMRDLHDNIRDVNQRENKYVNADKVKEECDKMIGAFNQTEKGIYGIMQKLGEESFNMQPKGPYRQHQYQDIICTKMAANVGKYTLGIIPPGNGKTFIIQQLAKLYAHLGFKVRIQTVNDVLIKQMEQMTAGYINKSKIQIGPCVMPTKDDQTLVFIIDEADAYVKDFAATFKDKHLTGVYSLRFAARVIFVTATKTAFLSDMLDMISGKTSDDYQLTFKSKAELSGNVIKNTTIQQKFFTDFKDMEEAIEADVVQFAANRPVIIFTEDMDGYYYDSLKEKYETDEVQFTQIKTDEEALVQRTRKKRAKRGVLVIDKKYARGVDLKMGDDAIVLVIANDIGLPWSLVQQMVGRGCRSFGISEGIYYTTLLTQEMDLEEQLTALEPQLYDGLEVLRRLYDNYDLVTNDIERMAIKNYFKDCGWAVRLNDFERNDNIGNTIKYGQQRKSGQEATMSVEDAIKKAIEANAPKDNT